MLLQPLLFVRMLAALEGAAWALDPPFFMVDDTLAIAGTGSFLDMIGVNAVSGQLAKWSFYLDTGRIGEIVGLFLVGLVLGRSGFFARPEDFRRSRRIALAGALLVSILLSWAKPALLDWLPAEPAAARQNLDWILTGWIALAVMTVQAVLFVELHQSVGRPLLRRLAPVGRMTLTLYVGQSLLFVPIFYGFGLGLHTWLTGPQALALGILAFLLQAVFAHAWFGRFHYGPLEWLWRALTYLRSDVPFLKRSQPAREAVG